MAKKFKVRKDKEGRNKIVLTHTGLRTQIKNYLKLYRIKFWYNKASQGSYPGLPDLEGVYDKDVFPGRPFFIEVKTQNQNLTKDQKAFKSMVEEAGEDYCVAHSLDEFLSWWRRFTNAKGENDH